ncbi:MAG: hypothetical protein V4502_09335 [Pseudomonadota bacterium]
MASQRHAMRHALKYIAKYQPPTWRIQQCNRNASRYRGRVDWMGVNNCVRNAALVYRPPPARPSQRSAAPHRRAARHRK